MAAQIRTTLVKWLDSQRQAYLRASQQAGLGPSVQVRVAVATKIEEHSATVDYETKSISPLAVPDLVWTLSQQVDTLGLEPPPVADVLAKFGEEGLPFTPFFPDDLALRTQMILEAAGREYLASLDSLDVADSVLAEQHATELVELFDASTIDYITALPLGGIKPPLAPITEGQLCLRALSPEECGLLFEARASNVGRAAPRRTVRAIAFSSSSERVVLELGVTNDKRVQAEDGLLTHRVVLALQLRGYELHGTGSATTWTLPGPTLFSTFPNITLAEAGSERECTAEDLRRAQDLAASIPQGAIWSPQTRPELVLHRFKLGVVEKSPVDSLVDYVVALESFLLGEKEGEYRFKFGLFGAWNLETDATAREKTARELRDVYDVRSQIVHGTIPNQDRVSTVVAKARDLTARMIVRALEEGWPTHEQLRRTCYG